MRPSLALALLLLAGGAHAAESPAPVVELELLAEHPIAGMAAGNLSGLTRCGEE